MRFDSRGRPSPATAGGGCPPWIDAVLVDRLVRRARETCPHEICGVLGAVDGRVVAAIEVPNRAAEPGRFDADPIALSRAERQLNRRGLRLVGYYHSHPTGGPQPSRADLAGELWPGCGPPLRLIVCPDGRWALYEAQRAAWRTVVGATVGGLCGWTVEGDCPP